ncbi:proteasome subunit alpha [Yinghuangia aomiensis]
MTTPFYARRRSRPWRDRADYARKGIARGRSVVVLTYADGILFVAENPSRALHKMSEIYDRIAFAAVGKYNEFENLRIGGVRYADIRGYSYARHDVTARGLANVYAQTLGTIFSSGGEKPYEVELIVAEVGSTPADDQIYRLTYDGSIADEQHYVAMGGNADQITEQLKRSHREGCRWTRRCGSRWMCCRGTAAAQKRTITAAQLEVAVLDRTRAQKRKFKRVVGAQLARLLGESASGAADAAAEGGTGADDDGGSGAVGETSEE